MQDIDQLVWEFSEAATRLAQLGALEGAAGNISVFLPTSAGHNLEISGVFNSRVDWAPPFEAALPHGTLVITGAGRRLRDVARDPTAVLCAVVIDSAGWTLLRAERAEVRPTSEIDTHIGIHAVLASTNAGHVQAVVHAQPPHLTWLSHIPAYRDAARLNRQLLRWQPETLVMLPEGVAVVPFETPGTVAQGRLTTDAAAQHHVIVWAKHGVVAHAPGGPQAAADLIDYVEAAARYEVLDIQAGRPADGMSLDEMRAVATRFGVNAGLLDMLPIERLR